MRPEREGRSASEVGGAVSMGHDSLTGEVPVAQKKGRQARQWQDRGFSGPAVAHGGTHSFTRHCGTKFRSGRLHRVSSTRPGQQTPASAEQPASHSVIASPCSRRTDMVRASFFPLSLSPSPFVVHSGFGDPVEYVWPCRVHKSREGSGHEGSGGGDGAACGWSLGGQY